MSKPAHLASIGMDGQQAFHRDNRGIVGAPKASMMSSHGPASRNLQGGYPGQKKPLSSVDRYDPNEGETIILNSENSNGKGAQNSKFLTSGLNSIQQAGRTGANHMTMNLRNSFDISSGKQPARNSIGMENELHAAA